jgi:phage tail-like protein
MSTDIRIDPFRAFNFEVAIDGIPAGGFSEVSGLSAKKEEVMYRNGNDVVSHSRKLTGRDSYESVSLKRGYTTDGAFWDWFKSLSNGNDDKRNMTVTLLNEARERQLTWEIENAWITAIMGPSLSATGNDVAIEEITLTVERVTLEIEA